MPANFHLSTNYKFSTNKHHRDTQKKVCHINQTTDKKLNFRFVQTIKKYIMLLVKLCIFSSILTLMLISAEMTSVDGEKNPESNARVGKFFGLFGLVSGK